MPDKGATLSERVFPRYINDRALGMGKAGRIPENWWLKLSTCWCQPSPQDPQGRVSFSFCLCPSPPEPDATPICLSNVFKPWQLFPLPALSLLRQGNPTFLPLCLPAPINLDKKILEVIQSKTSIDVCWLGLGFPTTDSFDADVERMPPNELHP